MNIKPRNDYVLLQVINVGVSPGGVHLPDRTPEGEQFIVKEIGPKVRGLKVGDRVLLMGTRNVNYIMLPNSRDLLVTREESIVLVFEDGHKSALRSVLAGDEMPKEIH